MDRSTPELVFLVCQFILERDYLITISVDVWPLPGGFEHVWNSTPCFMIDQIDHPFLLVDLCVVPHVESCVDFCWLNPLVSRQDMITKERVQRKVTGTRWSMDQSPINNRVSWDFTGITGIHTVISRVFYDGCPLIYCFHIENWKTEHWYSGFTYQKWWWSFVILVYWRV